MRWKRVRRRGRTGQSILEYLVIATVIVTAIFAIKATMGNNANNLYQAAANKVSQVAGNLGNFTPQPF